MKKIEPFMWVIFDDDGDYETNSVNDFSCGRSGGKPLYTREALEAMAYVMKQACQAEVKRAFGLDESFEAIDTADIINQLTGK